MRRLQKIIIDSRHARINVFFHKRNKQNDDSELVFDETGSGGITLMAMSNVVSNRARAHYHQPSY
jgi:hypothetical protein